ncbi:MAG TPA: hypothetical protein ENI29_22655 [bacterium]|nr:hypothetical protein [bacterium]
MSKINHFPDNHTLQEIEDLNKKFLEIKKTLNSIINLEEKNKNLWELKDISRRIKLKYSFLNRINQDNYKEQYSNWLHKEIYYFETCNKMLLNHLGALRNDYMHFMECATLEYEYHIILEKEYPQEFLGFTLDCSNLQFPPHLNLIYQNLNYSIVCILDEITRINVGDDFTFFIDFEILGNLYLQLFNFLSKFYTLSTEYTRIILRLSFHYYLQSINYLDKLEQQKPQTAFMGVDGSSITFFPLYYEFFQDEAISIQNVREKVNYLLQKYDFLVDNNVFDSLERELDDSNKFFDNKDYDEALRGYSSILNIKPLDFSVWLKKCATLYLLERKDDADKCVKCLLRINPIDWELLKNVLDLLTIYERKDLALKYIEIHGKEDSNEKKYLKSLGRIYFKLGLYDRAEEIYEKTLKNFGKDLDAIIALSQCKIIRGEFDLAMELIKKGRSIKQDDPKLNELSSELEKIQKARNIIKELKSFYDEIQFEIIMQKIDVDQSLLIRILESMIKKQEIIAKIRNNSLIFIKETLIEKVKQTQFKDIFIGRDGYWEVNQFHFKIKLENNSKNVITDIRIILDKFPEMLRIEGQELMKISHLEPEGGLWTPEFKMYAGDDCVSGKIHASIKFFDSSSKSLDYEVEPFEISYICPLLEAKNLDEIDYLRRTKKMIKLEKEIQLMVDYNQPKLLEEIKNKMEQMNLAIIKQDEDINSLYGYAEDKINHDGIALEAEIKSLFDGQISIILKAICEKDNKCAPLLHKAIEEITKLELYLEKSIIIDKLNMFIDKPNDLNKYIKKILKSNWADNKKNRWAKTVQEILEEWKTFKPKKWVKIAKAILRFTTSAIISEKLGDLVTFGFERLFEWIKISLEEIIKKPSK